MAKTTSKAKKKNLLPTLSILLSVASLLLVLLVVVEMKLTDKQNQVRIEQLMDEIQTQFDELSAIEAQQLTQPTNVSSGSSVMTGPVTYDLDASVVRVTQIEFDANERFDAEYFESLAAECQKPLDAEVFAALESELSGQGSYEYIFTYTGESQPPESYSVTAIPNVHGYETLEAFNEHYEYCAAGGEAYPVAVNADWLMFESSCGTGFADDSGLPIGCSEVKESLEDSVQLK